jgi:hypothetical protein
MAKRTMLASVLEIDGSFRQKTRVIPAKAGIHFHPSRNNGFPLSRE